MNSKNPTNLKFQTRFVFLTIAISFPYLFLQPVFSQVNFSKRYNLPAFISQFVSHTTDGGYFYVCSYNANIIVAKADSIGDIVWANEIGVPTENEVPYDMVTLDNGNLVALIRSGGSSQSMKTFLVSFDLQGNLVFCKRYGPSTPLSTVVPNNIIKDGSGFILSVDNMPNSESHFLRCDSIGNRTGGTSLPGSNILIFKRSNGNYNSYMRSTGIICSFDSSLNYLGNTYSDIDYSYINYGILEVSPNSFIIYGGGNIFLPFYAKLNGQMQYIWEKVILGNGFQVGKIVTAKKTGPNKITMIGQGETFGVRPFILDIDTLGNVIRSILIDQNGINTDYIQSHSSYRNGQFAFMSKEYIPGLGSFFKVNATDSSYANICNKYDTTITFLSNNVTSHGSTTYSTFSHSDSLVDEALPISTILINSGICNDTTLSLVDIGSENQKLDVWPNPFDEYLIVRTISDESYQMELYDLMLRKIYVYDINSNFIINTLTYQPGMYIYKVFNGKKFIQSGKLIKY